MASRHGVCDYRMALIGITGAGKSSTGNTLIGEKVFQSSGSYESVTKECSSKETERFGNSILVVDTPGILDTAMTEEELKIQLMECTFLACPGVHAFLFVMKIGQRDIGKKEKEVFHIIKEFLGEKILLHTVIVFTGKESLEEDGLTLEKHISGMEKEYQNFIKSCKGGVVSISNIGTKEEKEKAARQIIDTVGKLIGRSKICYQNVLFDEKNEKINRKMEQILQENEKIQHEIRKISEELKSLEKVMRDGGATRRQRDNLCDRLKKLPDKIVQRKDLRKVANKRLQFESKIEGAKRAAIIVSGGTIVGAVGTVAVAGGVAGIAVAAGVGAGADVAGVTGILSVVPITALATYVTGRRSEKK